MTDDAELPAKLGAPLDRFCFMTMCRLVLILLASYILPASQITAQQAPVQQASEIKRDPKALSLIQQATATAGLGRSIESIQDAVATGTTSIPNAAENMTPGSVTISSRGLDHLKIDAVYPTGKWSSFYSHGTTLRKDPKGETAPLHGDDSALMISHYVPLVSLAAALADATYSVTFVETTKDPTTGDTLNHLRVQQKKSIKSGSLQFVQTSMAIDYYIDASTNLIVQETHLHLDRGHLPTGAEKPSFEIIRFSNYQLDGGLFLPHQITFSVDKRLTSTFSISSYQLNSGLQDSDLTAQ